MSEEKQNKQSLKNILENLLKSSSSGKFFPDFPSDAKPLNHSFTFRGYTFYPILGDENDDMAAIFRPFPDEHPNAAPNTYRIDLSAVKKMIDEGLLGEIEPPDWEEPTPGKQLET